jgi:hypothetical protein
MTISNTETSPEIGSRRYAIDTGAEGTLMMGAIGAVRELDVPVPIGDVDQAYNLATYGDNILGNPRSTDPHISVEDYAKLRNDIRVRTLAADGMRRVEEPFLEIPQSTHLRDIFRWITLTSRYQRLTVRESDLPATFPAAYAGGLLLSRAIGLAEREARGAGIELLKGEERRFRKRKPTDMSDRDILSYYMGQTVTGNKTVTVIAQHVIE